MYFLQYKAKEYSKSLSDAKERLNKINVAKVRSDAETKIAEVKGDSEKTIMSVKIEAGVNPCVWTDQVRAVRQGL